MRSDDPILDKVENMLEEKHLEILAAFVHSKLIKEYGAELREFWDSYLGQIGARRVGKLMGIVAGPEEGHVRLDDPHAENGNKGFIDMPRATAEKVAVLGLP
jgi:hypothetical protein